MDDWRRQRDRSCGNTIPASQFASRFERIQAVSSPPAFSSSANSWTQPLEPCRSVSWFPTPQGLLKPEMYATANVRQTGRSSALYLPDQAIQDIDGVPVVFVRHAQIDFEARTVKTGQHVDGETEILEGLHPGEDVVVMGSFLLKSADAQERDSGQLA